jgi:hypothetical protein
LLSEKGGRGFPYLVYLDAEGGVLGSPKGRTVKAFEDGLADAKKEVARLAELRKKAASGDAEAVALLLESELKTGRVTFADGQKRRAAMKNLSPETAQKLDAALTELEVRGVMSGLKSREDLPKAAEQFRAMVAAGRTPTGENAGTFWNVLFSDAEMRKDVDAATAALEGMKKVSGTDQRSAMVLKNMETRIAKMKEGGAPAPKSDPK